MKVERFFVQRMKTKWGSCNPDARTHPPQHRAGQETAECLEYIVVHEMVHLLERHHTERFIALMDENLPQWRQLRNLLNAAPLGYESWHY